jgi:hypothetical protein
MVKNTAPFKKEAASVFWLFGGLNRVPNPRCIHHFLPYRSNRPNSVLGTKFSLNYSPYLKQFLHIQLREIVNNNVRSR